MAKRTRVWQLARPKPPRKPPVPDELRGKVEARAVEVAADLKARLRKPPAKRQWNWAEDVFVRWHREALYFVVVMRTPHGFPETFETHAARMEHAGAGKFDMAIPMRRGWNTLVRKTTPDECFEKVRDTFLFF